ncbi:MAG: hypothetical protein KAW41_02945 [Candidatus Diapherotrites archaeon]|nr:hypothetical protein [Candidatus Diapherotrites archaeon]
MRDWLFKQYWRINRARNVLSLFFWIAMLVGIWVPLIQIVVPMHKWALSIMVGLLCLAGALVIGYAWDKMGLWQSETRQMVKRNVAYIEPTKKEKNYLIPLQLETARAVAKMTNDKRLAKQIKEVESWLSK